MENKDKEKEIDTVSLDSVKIEKDDAEYSPMVTPFELTEAEQKKMLKSEQFLRGIQDGAYGAGVFTALVNSGIDIILAHELTAGMMSKEAAKEIHKLNIEIAKIKAIGNPEL